MGLRRMRGPGAVGMGCIKLGISKPKELRKKQAVAAAGQSQLMRMYEETKAFGSAICYTCYK